MKNASTIALLLKAAGLAVAAAAAREAPGLDGPQAAPIDTSGPEPSYNATLSNLEARAQKNTGICGVFANGDWMMAKELIGNMNGKLSTRTWTIQRHECNRVTCWDTTAIYVCNDNNHDITVTGKQIGKATTWIGESCCGQGIRRGKVLNGQQFTPWGWNVAVGYGNCRDPARIRPSNAGGHGVNSGECSVYSSGIETKIIS